MFELKDKIKFVTVNQNYLKTLHQIDSEIYYKENGYNNKPYIGILLNNNGSEYVIPLSSAKPKHKKWGNSKQGCLVIYEVIKKKKTRKNNIWVSINHEYAKHILSIIDTRKMFPVYGDIVTQVYIQPQENDTEDIKKYKDLLQKEYAFCVSNVDKIIDNANKIYNKQIESGTIAKYCCDFKKLEQVCQDYRNKREVFA